MVTDAVFTDIDNDDDDDLIIVGEWMAIKVLTNEKGSLKMIQINILKKTVEVYGGL